MADVQRRCRALLLAYPAAYRAQRGDEIVFWVRVAHHTTRLAIGEGTSIELSEVSPNGMTLQLPRNTCATGQLLLIDLFQEKKRPLYPPRPREILMTVHATAKVLHSRAS